MEDERPACIGFHVFNLFGQLVFLWRLLRQIIYGIYGIIVCVENLAYVSK